MELLVLAGFLGSGKTTLMIRLARAALERGRRPALIVNEAGEIGVDNALMRQAGMNVWEILGGCVCCTLAGSLVNTLHILDQEYACDVVMVEPSGTAELRQIHNGLKYYRGRPLERIHNAVLLDPLRFQELFEVLTPLLSSQIQDADTLIITKTDVAGHEQIEATRKIARQLRPNAPIFEISRDGALDDALLKELLG